MGATFIYIAGFTFACLVSYAVGEATASRGIGRYWGYVAIGLGFGALDRAFDLGGSSPDARILTGVSLGVVGLAIGARLTEALERRGLTARHALAVLGFSAALTALGFLALRGFATLATFALVTSQSRTAAALLVGVALLAPALGERRPDEPRDETGLRLAALVASAALVFFASATGASSVLFAPDPGMWAIVFASVMAPLLAAGIGAGLSLLLAALASDRLPTSLLAPSLLVVVIGFSLLLERASWLASTDAGIATALVLAVAAGLAARRERPRLRLRDATEALEPLVYIVFFTFIGTRLSASTIVGMAPFAVILLGLRVAVVDLGTRVLSASAVELDASRGTLMRVLLPHGAVALVLVGAVGTEFPMVGDTVVALAIVTVLISEAFGPWLASRLARTRMPSADRGATT